MAKTHCKYHPQAPARWRCPSCEVDFCPQCVKKTGLAQNIPTCHACGGELESLGMGNVITPFWERIPRFFQYPFRVDALMYLGMLSIASLAVFIPLFGFLIYLMISYAILKYGYLILNHTARGNLSPPEVLGANLAANHNLPLKQSVVFLLMAVLVFVAAFGGAALGVIALLFMMFSVPASVMSLAVNGTIGAALNPVVLAGVMKRIGFPYLILYVFLLLLSGGSAATQALLEAVLPGWLLIILITFVSAYFTVIMFNMMGYVVYQYHEALGFDQVREFDAAQESATATPAAPADAFETELNILVNEGKLEEAKERVRRRVDGVACTPDDRERYHKLLQLSKDKQESSRCGPDYVKALINLQQGAKAVQVFGECLALDPQFQLPDARDTYRLAECAHSMGKNDLVLQMLNRFSKRFAKHADIPRAYLMVAKLLCEHKDNDAQAKSVLDGLLRQYPDHELAGEIREYRKFVERISSGGAAAASPGQGLASR